MKVIAGLIIGVFLATSLRGCLTACERCDELNRWAKNEFKHVYDALYDTPEDLEYHYYLCGKGDALIKMIELTKNNEELAD